MLAIGIIVGFVLGFIFAVLCISRLVIGTLKMTRDSYDDETYMYVELDRPYYPKHKFVVMRVNNSQL